MGNQSDIQSQQSVSAPRSVSNPARSLGVSAPVPAQAGSVDEPGYAVTVYDARLPNAVDYIFPNPQPSIFGLSNPAIVGPRADFNVPVGYSFVARSLQFSCSVAFTAQSPFAVPANTNVQGFLTDINGFPNVRGLPLQSNGGSPVCLVIISVNGANTLYNNIYVPWAPYMDYTLPLFLPVDDSSLIQVHLGIQTTGGVPAPLYNPFIYDCQMLLAGNLIPATGYDASQETLNHDPLPVRVIP